MASALILIADGTEEMEFTISYDVLVRAGLKVTAAGVQLKNGKQGPAVCSRGLRIIPDVDLEDLGGEKARSYSLLVIPGGGPGAATLSQASLVQSLVQTYYGDPAKTVGMICAGTLVAKTSGIAKGKKVTSHPSVKQDLEKDYDYSEDRVVVSENLVTSRGPGTAFLFALTLAERVAGQEKRREIEGPMILAGEL